MPPLLLISILFTALVYSVHGEQPCTTPSGANGLCKSLMECDPLLAIINNPKKTREDMQLIRKSACGFLGEQPLVCCPDDSCQSPDWQTGKCINLYSCHHLSKMLIPPVSKEAYSFVLNSKCKSSDPYSVCCAASPDPESKTTPAPKPAPEPKPEPTPAPEVCPQSHAAPNITSGCCGVDAKNGDKIVGGTATSVDQYPWLAAVEYLELARNQLEVACGGALISGRYVLTAAHCVLGIPRRYSGPKSVRLGEYDTSNELKAQDCVEAPGGGLDCTDGAISIAVEKTIPHPEYDPKERNRWNDIALLRLQELAPYTDFVRPICLPTVDLTIAPPPQFRLFAAGWGATEDQNSSPIKLHVDLPFMAKEKCQTVFTGPVRGVALWEGQFCAGGEKDKDSCKGDSGGPLMYELDRHFQVTGVVSFGLKPCALSGMPGVYTNVYMYKDWIVGEMKP